MLAGMIIIAMLSGLVAAGLSLMLSMPFWAAILAYALTGSVALVIAALSVGGPSRRDTAPDAAAAVPAVPGK